MSKYADSRRNSLRNLWCSAAFVGVVFASNAAQSRGIFEDRGTKPTIEVNLGVIQQLRAERAAVPAAVVNPIPQNNAEIVDIPQENSSPMMQSAVSENENAPLEVLPGSLPETEEAAESLPIVVKEVEAPVAPIYQGGQIVQAPEEIIPQEKRTLVSVFESWFGGKTDAENIAQDDISFAQDEGNADESTPDVAESDDTVAESFEDVAMDDGEVDDVLQIDSLPPEETQPESIVVYSREQSTPSDDAYIFDGEDEEIVNTGETKVNRIAVDAENADEDASDSFFNRLFKALKPSDIEEKRQAIVVDKPDVDVLEDRSSSSIFGDTAKIAPDGAELLDDAQPEEDLFASTRRVVEEKPLPSSLDENKYSAVEPNKNVQIILPNKVKNDDLIMRLPTPSAKPKTAAQVATAKRPEAMPVPIVKKPEIELAQKQPEKNTVAIANVFEKVEETSRSSSVELAKKDQKLPFLTPVEEEELIVEPKKPIEQVVDFIEIEQPQEENSVVIKPSKLANAPIDIMAPAIPDATEVVQETQSEALQATPIIMEEEKMGFAERLQGWLPFGKKEADISPDNIRETALSEMNSDDLPPPSLPDVVEVAADVEESVSVIAPTAPVVKAIPDVFEVEDEPELPQAVQIILPNEINDETPLEIASLDSKVVEKVNEHVAKESQANILSLNFIPAQTEIMADEKARIASFAKAFADDKTKRLKIVSYASQVENNTGSARRISLQRAIAIRSVMIDSGVNGVRINVQAMGDKVDGGIVDRADIELIGN